MSAAPQRAVVLDLDNTLIHSVARPDHRYKLFRASCGLWVHVRPGTEALLQALAAAPDVYLGVWTAGLPKYAVEVVAALLRISGLRSTDVRLVLTRDEATVVDQLGYVKDLAHVRAVLGVEDVTLVDDNHAHGLFNRGHSGTRVSTVRPFHVAKELEDSSCLDAVRNALLPRSVSQVARYSFPNTPGAVVKQKVDPDARAKQDAACGAAHRPQVSGGDPCVHARRRAPCA